MQFRKPMDEIHGGTRCWGSQTDPGVLITALKAWTYSGGFSPFSIPLNLCLQAIEATPHLGHQLPQLLRHVPSHPLDQHSQEQGQVSSGYPKMQPSIHSIKNYAGTTEDQGAALETPPLLSRHQHQSRKPTCDVKAMHLSLRKGPDHLRSKMCIIFSSDRRL